MVEAIFVKVDVSKEAECEKMVKSAVGKYGKLDILFNNAGIPSGAFEVADIKEEHWRRVMSINLEGALWGTKYAVPEMIKGGGGSIVNTSSVGASAIYPKMSIYSISKAGVIQLTKATAVDYGKYNIRANCILPTAMLTKFLEQPGSDPNFVKMMVQMAANASLLGRLPRLEEVAHAALFLASDDSSFITGHSLIVDGGLSIQGK